MSVTTKRMRRLFLLSALLSASASCGRRSVTQLVFRVEAEDDNSDRWLDSVELRVRDARAIDRGGLSLPVTVTNESFPIEWGLLPSERDRGASIEVIAEGRRGSSVQSQQRALVSFVSDRVVRVDLFLARACTLQRVEYCRTLIPGVELTCGRAGRCEPVERTGGVALDRDAEASVSFVDATAPDVVLATPDAAQDSGNAASDASDAAMDSDAVVDTGAPPVDTGAPPRDSGVAPVDTGVPPIDTGVPPTDTGVPPRDSGVPSTDSGCSPRVVINEAQVFEASVASREYVELHNAGTCAASLEGWTLAAEIGATNPELFRFNATHVIAPGGYLLIADITTPMLSMGVPRWASGGLGLLGDSIGGLRLVDNGGVPIDRLGWSDSAMFSPSMGYFEGTPKLYPPGRAVLVLSRSPNGQDTNNNTSDFVFNLAPSPGAMNR